MDENYGIYIHFPFCRRKCLYCDFYSLGGRNFDWVSFSRAVENEYSLRKMPEGSLSTLYFGGGTPSLAPVETLYRFREMIGGEVGEFTMEVNPDDVTEERAREWKDVGVNRISMGVQSLDDGELHFIGRRHTASAAIEAYNILRRYFSNISLDLMFGLPGQTLSSLSSTLDGFMALRPEHISAYSLMYEERSALTRLRDAGRVEELPEEESVEMFRLITDRLKDGGYERYEISNYSLPGYRSHHNSNYWKGVPYIGLGPSAHSFDGDKVRRYNVPDLSLYLKRWNGDRSEIAQSDVGRGKDLSLFEEVEILSPDELREEMIMTRLRTVEGLDLSEYATRFGEKERIILERKIRRFMSSGLILLSESNHVSLSDEGVMISDDIISSLF